MKVEPLDAGRVRFSYDFVYPRGGVQHLEWDGRFDGKDSIVQGADEYITYAYRETGNRTYEIVAKLDSRVTAVAEVTIAPDGRTLTTTTRSRNARGEDVTNTTVYEKTNSLTRHRDPAAESSETGCSKAGTCPDRPAAARRGFDSHPSRRRESADRDAGGRR